MQDHRDCANHCIAEKDYQATEVSTSRRIRTDRNEEDKLLLVALQVYKIERADPT